MRSSVFFYFIIFILLFLLIKFIVGAGTDVAGEVIEVGLGIKNFKASDKVVAKLVSATLNIISIFFSWINIYFKPYIFHH